MEFSSLSIPPIFPQQTESASKKHCGNIFSACQFPLARQIFISLATASGWNGSEKYERWWESGGARKACYLCEGEHNELSWKQRPSFVSANRRCLMRSGEQEARWYELRFGNLWLQLLCEVFQLESGGCQGWSKAYLSSRSLFMVSLNAKQF